MSWSLFKITQVDVEPVTHELKRLADMFEIYLRLAYDYHVTPPKPLDESADAEPSSVEYADDQKLASAEIKEQVSMFQHVIDESDEVDPL